MSDVATTLATADELFAPAKRRYKTTTMPVSGKTVRIQSLTERETSNYEAQALAKSGSLRLGRLEDANRRLIALCLVDGAGNRILNGSFHVAKIAEWDSADAKHVYRECALHTGINTDEVEDLVKNSENVTVED